ncbi:MAG: nitrile hydratase accessory protein [Actinomycetota bacterium]|nr:nitrile hydratase accessory protein [Actinomycetota bacterium]
MTHSLGRPVPEMEGLVSYPRKNGEPIFEEPWQSRAFGMVVALHQEGLFHWDEFKERLIAETLSAGKREERATDPVYYEHWLTAFWKLVSDKGILCEAEMEARKAEFESGFRIEVY